MPSIWTQAWEFFKSWFNYPGLTPVLALIAVALGLAFGAIWLILHRPPLFRRPWLWVVAVFSAFFTLAALSFIQIPLQWWIGTGMLKIWDDATLVNWLLLATLPQILVTGLVQEGAKMVPMVAWWWRSGRAIDPKLGLAIGALAGAGYGIFEGVWVHNQILASGWTWAQVSINGYLSLAGFWERFWAIGFHIAASALAGYGLAKRKGWQFYLIAAGLHAVLNYSAVLSQKGYLSTTYIELYVAVLALIAAAWALWLRWIKQEEMAPPDITPVAIPTVERQSPPAPSEPSPPAPPVA